MAKAIAEVEAAVATLGKGSPWDGDLKVSDEFLAPLMENFYKRIGLPVLLNKGDYYQIAKFCEPKQLGDEVHEVLDSICDIADAASTL